METEKMPAIYSAILAVKEEINGNGVGKERENVAQKFSYRGIDDALNAFSGPFARQKILPTQVFETTVRDIITTKNSTMMRTVVSLVCTFLSLEDGSSITVGPFEGEAVDVLDKATTKATSVALRNLLFMTFTVPFSGEIDPEADESGNEVVGQADAGPKLPQKIALGISSMTKLEGILKEAGRDQPWLLEKFGGVDRNNVVKAAEFIKANPA